MSKNKADAITKNRVIHLAKPINIETIALVKSVLLGLKGVDKVRINISNIYVTYDLKQVKEIQIEEALSEVELAIKNNWFERLRRRLI